jgi:hypothetical protein
MNLWTKIAIGAVAALIAYRHREQDAPAPAPGRLDRGHQHRAKRRRDGTWDIWDGSSLTWVTEFHMQLEPPPLPAPAKPRIRVKVVSVRNDRQLDVQELP